MDNVQEFDLCRSAYGVTRGLHYDVVLLPWGATEPHNLHLPYLTDCILSHDIAVDAAKQAFAQYGVRAMVMPPVTMGAQNPGQRDLCFCVHARYETQRAILHDIVDSLYHQGFRKMIIVNGHGGNSFKNMLRDLAVDYPDFILGAGEWFKMASPKDFFDNPGDHADEVETSVMMYYHPDLVDLSKAGPGHGHGYSIEALSAGRIWIPRDWSLASPDDTGIGDPSLSSAEKGERFAKAVVEGYAKFLRDFAAVKSGEDLF